MQFEGSLPHSKQPTACPYPSQIHPIFCPSQFSQLLIFSSCSV